MILAHILTYYYTKIQFIIVFISMCRSSDWSLYFRFPHRSVLCVSRLSHEDYGPPPFLAYLMRTICLSHFSPISWGLQSSSISRLSHEDYGPLPFLSYLMRTICLSHFSPISWGLHCSLTSHLSHEGYSPLPFLTYLMRAASPPISSFFVLPPQYLLKVTHFEGSHYVNFP
jgi:hypothetical protein